MADVKKTIFIGDNFEDVLQLRLQDARDESHVDPFPLGTPLEIEVRFPGGISLKKTASEVTIVDADLSTISYAGSTTKSALLTAGLNAALDVIVTDADGKITTFEALKVLDIKRRQN